MSGIVVFDLPKFRSLYSNLKSTDDQLNWYFVEATMLLNNTEKSCVKSLAEREVLLFLLVAHFAVLQQRVEGDNEVVGRVSSASQGSVSVTLDNGQTTLSDKWYQQTPYGSKYWALTSKYRSFLYVATNIAMPVRR